MQQHIFSGTGAPSTAPNAIGSHYISDDGTLYIAKGSSSPSDWVEVEVGGTATTLLSAHIAASDPHSQYTTQSEAAAAAPVQSVNGQTGAVVVTAPVQSVNGQTGDVIVANGNDPILGDVKFTAYVIEDDTWALAGTSLPQSVYPEAYALIGHVGGTYTPGAGWTGIYAGNENWTAVETNGVGSIVFGALDGSAARSGDSGNTWAPVDLLFDGSRVNAIRFGNGVMIAVGANGKASRSTNGGATWTSITTFPASNLSGVATNGAGTWVAVNNAGQAFRSSDDGVTWVELTGQPFNGIELRDVAASTSGIWIIVGLSSNCWRSSDNGVTWTAVAHNLGTTSALCVGVYDSYTIWCIGGASGKISRSSNSGASFTAVTSGVSGGVNVLRRNNTTVWVGGTTSDYIRSDDDGVTWTTFNTAVSPFSTSGVQDVVWHTNTGFIFVTYNGEAGWSGDYTYAHNTISNFLVPAFPYPSGGYAWVKVKP